MVHKTYNHMTIWPTTLVSREDNKYIISLSLKNNREMLSIVVYNSTTIVPVAIALHRW